MNISGTEDNIKYDIIKIHHCIYKFNPAPQYRGINMQCIHKWAWCQIMGEKSVKGLH